MTTVQGSEPWYLAPGRHGQELLDGGRVSEAVEVFESVVAGFGTAASYGRAVVLERLGRALLLAGQPDRAIGRLREALEVAGRLAPTGTVHRLRCSIRSASGDALRAGGRFGEARRAYLAAVEIARELRDPRSEGIDQGRLGTLALAQGDISEALDRSRRSLDALRQLGEPAIEAVAWLQLGRLFRRVGDADQAGRHYEEAARLREAQGDVAAAAGAWAELAELYREADRPEEAERCCRRAVDAARRGPPTLRLAEQLLLLAELVGARPDRADEAAALAEQSLALAQRLQPDAPAAWKAYGLLAELHERRHGPGARTSEYRELARRAPLIAATLEHLGAAPTVGRAVLLNRLGRCFCLGGRPDLAVDRMREAVAVADQLAGSDAAAGLPGMLWLDLGNALGLAGQTEEARHASETGLARSRLGEHVAPAAPEGVEVHVTEQVSTDYAFEPDLLLDGSVTRRMFRVDEGDGVPEGARPLVSAGTRTWQDTEGRIRLSPLADEPAVHAEAGCTILRRVTRELTICGDTGLVWRLLGSLDGRETCAAILAGLPEEERPLAARVLGALATAGVLDLSGRPFGRFLHWSTRKGALAAGGLEGDDVLRLATDGAHRSRAGAPREALGVDVPEPLRALHALTRARRSTRDFRGDALSREEFDALLGTACGTTGSIRWSGREVRLRAYPSSGALYAVGVYPVVFRVEGLDPAVYNFDADGHALERVDGPFDPTAFVQASLPMERALVAGIATMICLTGYFPRHERKYGEGGYRMLVAEAGHISQNLVLAATALGLAARPFGGVFDSLLNRALGLDESREQFLLAVVAGR